MPSFTINPGDLSSIGPVVETIITPSARLIAALTRNNQPVPQPLKILALVDTGAQITVINPAIVQSLSLPPVGSIQMNTPSTTQPLETTQHAIDVSFFVNGIVMATVQNIVAAQGTLVGQNIQALIGRDVLRHGVLIYTGYINQFTLSF